MSRAASSGLGCERLPTTVRGVAAARGRIISTAKFDDFAAGRVLDDFFTFDEIGITQPDFPAGHQAEEFLGRIFHEIIPFNIYLACKRNLPRSGCFIFGIVDCIQLLDLILRIIGDDNLNGIQYCHYPV